MSSNLCLFIRHARILSPTGEFFIGDVETHGGQIVQVKPEIPVSNVTSAARVIDANGLTLLPGVIDPQVHFREPGLEHKEDLFTASCACARGGVTSFLEMPNTRTIIKFFFQPFSMALLILSLLIMPLTPWKKKRKATLTPLPECRE